MLRAGMIKVMSPLFRFLLTHNIMIQAVERHMSNTSPKKYRDDLIPSYRKFFSNGSAPYFQTNDSRSIALGCRRILYVTGYLEALHRPNITLRSNDIEAIVEDGIVTKNGNDFFWVL
jgi:cation diffusion facilitator CzcD-associated flavoprotein CzcO